MSKQYEITVSGCDDHTTIVRELTESELATVTSIAEAITHTSTHDCEPRMSVIEHFETEDEQWH